MEQKINPLSDFLKTFKGKEKVTVVFVIIETLVSLFVSGLLMQYVLVELGRKRHIVLMSSFAYGLKFPVIIFTILQMIFYCICYFRFLRMQNLGKKDYEDGVERSANATFNNAHFQTPEEEKKNFLQVETFADTNEEILGKEYDTGKYMSLRYPAGKNHNRLFCGSPGSGKTSAIIKTDIYQCIRRGQSIVVTDSKGDLYNETVAVAIANNYTIRVLNTKEKELVNSNGFNVMANLDPNSYSFAAECSSIANIIVDNTQGKDESMDYWAKNEVSALAMVIMHLACSESYKSQGMNNLYGVFQYISTKTTDEMREEFSRYPNGTPIRNAYMNFSKATPANQGQIMNGLAERLWMLNNPVLAKVLANNEIDLVLPMQQPCIYYVIIPDNDNVYSFITSLFFTTMFKAQSDWHDAQTQEKKKSHLEVYYELDEYKNIGGIRGLDTKMSTVRSRKIQITIILQLLNQLTLVHGEDAAKEILNDCTVKGLLSTSDMDTAKYFSDMLGSFTVVTAGERFEEDKINIFHMHGYTKQNRGEQNRPLRYPESLMNDKMDRDDVIYVIDNMSPVKMKKAFSELAGEAIHFMEMQGRKFAEENGEMMANQYVPEWRQKEMVNNKPAEENTSSNTETRASELKPSEPSNSTSAKTSSVESHEVTKESEEVTMPFKPNGLKETTPNVSTPSAEAKPQVEEKKRSVKDMLNALDD